MIFFAKHGGAERTNRTAWKFTIIIAAASCNIGYHILQAFFQVALGQLAVLLIQCSKIFVFLIFVVLSTNENYMTIKISCGA